MQILTATPAEIEYWHAAGAASAATPTRRKILFQTGGINRRQEGGRKSYWASPMTARQIFSFEELPNNSGDIHGQKWQKVYKKSHF